MRACGTPLRSWVCSARGGAGLYQPYWSADILKLERNLAKCVCAAGAKHRVAVMRQHFGEVEITGLPDAGAGDDQGS